MTWHWPYIVEIVHSGVETQPHNNLVDWLIHWQALLHLTWPDQLKWMRPILQEVLLQRTPAPWSSCASNSPHATKMGLSSCLVHCYNFLFHEAGRFHPKRDLQVQPGSAVNPSRPVATAAAI